ncbi:hypothetical protein LUZ60_014367 [Juncus effusus]|nr:hypothetical protein LUZ60_014367 [Juncus effusus]
MGKQGPCCHCGITTTPLWRNGPPEKPVLCNACGSRWRTKGTLVNYTPTHSKELCTNSEEFEIKPKPLVKFKNMYNKKGETKEDSGGSFQKVLEQESTTSSSVSWSDSTAKNDLPVSILSDSWVSLIPSKKRTYVTRPKSPTKPSHVLQLTQDLHSILHQEKNTSQNSSLEDDDDDDLVYKRDASDEIGYGSVLIRNDVNKGSDLDCVKREKVGNEKSQVMRGEDSPLVLLNLQDKMTSGSTSQISSKRPCDYQNHIYTEPKDDKRSPKKVCKSGPAIPSPQDKNRKFTYASQFLEKQGVSCLIPVPLQYSQENLENDLLMDVPHNAPSPEAELLYNGPLKVKSLENSSSVLVDSEITGENSSSSHTIK